MRYLNRLNKIYVGVAFVLAGLFLFKVITYKASEKFYYTASVSNPKEFPVRILGIGFELKNGSLVAPSFHLDEEMINSFLSDWGRSEYNEAYEPQFLPESLFLEYVDFRTKNYYADTIQLPKEKMTAIFRDAKKNNLLENLTSWGVKKGLKYHIGIANDGNIIFWLTGSKFEKEFYRTQLQPKPFPRYIRATNQPVADKDVLLNQLFEELADSVKAELKKEDSFNVQYKDSIPKYFHNLQP